MTRLVARRLRGERLSDVDLELSPGLHVLLGDPDGVAGEFVELVAGLRAPRRGTLLLDGRPPRGTPAVRRATRTLFAVERLPFAPSVATAVARVQGLRGEAASPAEILAAAGLSHRATAAPSTLSPVELRRIALELALVGSGASVLLLVEPLGTAAPREAVLARIAERASSGALVLVVTASADDAAAVGGEVLVVEGTTLERGRRRAAELPGCRKLVGTDDPRALLAALVGDAALRGVDWDERIPGAPLVLAGHSGPELAAAVLRASRRSGARLHLLTDAPGASRRP